MRRKRKLTDLTVREVAAITKEGRHRVSRNLYLEISGGSRLWMFVYMFERRTRQMSLGSVDVIPLKDAREKVRKLRAMLADDIDPLTEKKAHRLARTLAAAKSITFEATAEAFVKSREAKWKDPRHAAAWRSSFRLHCGLINPVPISAIDTALVVDVLTPLWNSMPAAGKKLRLRIEQILAAAKVRGLRQGDNPAVWKNHLDKIFVSPLKVRPVKHYATVPVDELPGLMARIAERDSIAAKALAFLCHTCVRSAQIRKMRWGEVDFSARIWVSPPEHVKSEKGSTQAHRIPLSAPALAILEALPRTGDLVFPMGTNAMRDELRSVHAICTCHGLRSAYKDWCRTQPFPDEISEISLGHAVGDKRPAQLCPGRLAAPKGCAHDGLERVFDRASQDNRQRGAAAHARWHPWVGSEARRHRRTQSISAFGD
jgi:integrase